MKQKLTKDQQLLVDTLKTTKKKQGLGCLHALRDDSWCCLGIACDLFIDKSERGKSADGYYEEFPARGETKTLPNSLVKRLRLRSRVGDILDDDGNKVSSLVELNDEGGLTFKEIAEFIEANHEKVFKPLPD